MSTNLKARIDATFSRDRAAAVAFVLGVWLAVGLVYFAVMSLVDDGAIRAVLSVAALLVLVFNTASMVAMISHYSHDKEFIYGIDIRHLDEARGLDTSGHDAAVASARRG